MKNQSKNLCISFKNFSYSHSKKAKNLVNNLNFKLCSGDILFIIGPSGVGKTSFFLALFQDIFVTGQLIWQGKNLLKEKKAVKKKFAKSIGFLSQIPTSISFQSVYTNLAKSLATYKNFFYSLFAIPTKKQRLQICQILTRLGLYEKIYTIFQDLSGGQQQRVEVAKLMLQKPKIILADEPISALDPKTATKIIDLIIEFGKKNNSITLIISHDIFLLKNYNEKILLINEGQGRFFNSFSEIDKNEIDSIFGKENSE
ncbi:ATP-binding cassette domain-containing protein [Mycoplasma flocculare]|uniref:ATP-binding cassette domain-containing protein n=1 Tax=Mesomycoplasma flocculare TaxID=2128 RepID=A0AAW9XBK6_MESFC|nr:ATP-binding cassette domain-containing protein [Mesomycoplasma flocculare]MXR39714.1 ATP-binding cassette domain-containing protein [Mycoplasma sp. MF12]MXR06110.1 ATP-binding cassette domain-containing protein [Mesomycoplasma flocculare]MXR12519.1 ATP-binding cassette domain-containing protein [Mesomycoplasma flocculare]MXR13797.1 ATP-binding cassette domain-containing protein [Mesomycoplasma flocculare]MXR22814.1 ATP-binding cassette domain-containing protein [Mesomycoplasma flocculare]